VLCYVCYMKTISHRELRNSSSAILREVASGETVAVTNHGEVVATLHPATAATDLRCVRPAKKQQHFSAMVRQTIPEPSIVTLDELRGER